MTSGRTSRVAGLLAALATAAVWSMLVAGTNAAPSVSAGPASPISIGAPTNDGTGGPSTLETERTTASRTAASRPTATTRPARDERRSFTVVFTGDFLLHQRVNSVAAGHAAGDPDRTYDYRPLLEPVRPWIESASWAVCHMEVNLSADGIRLQSYPAFRAPGQIAFDAADIGYDSCTTGSNHTLDHGVSGVAETLQVLDDAGLHSTGSARTPEEAADQIWLDIEGVRVAHLSYTYWFNGIPLPAEAPWTANQIDLDRILADTTAARGDGAEYVVVSMHWGEQYRHEPNEQQLELGPQLAASSDIDLIIGHHAHVVQPIERVDGTWLVYGLGNFLSNQQQLPRRDELLVRATVSEQRDGTFDTEVAVVPLYLDFATLVVHPTNPGARPGDLAVSLDAELDASWHRVQAVLETGSGYDRLTFPTSPGT